MFCFFAFVLALLLLRYFRSSFFFFSTPYPFAHMQEFRRSRLSAGIRSLLAVSLAAAILIVVNLISTRLYVHGTYDNGDVRQLSERTIQTLGNICGTMELYAVFERSHPFRQLANILVHELEEAAAAIPDLTIKAYSIDANRDIVETSTLLRKYPMEINSILLVQGDRFRVLDAFELGSAQSGDSSRESKRASLAFRGEQACLGAMLRVNRPERIPVYFLSGHGEFDPASSHPITGASVLSSLIASDGYSVQTLILGENRAIPQDCAVLVIAGPHTLFSQQEMETISRYLSGGGRLLLLLDNAYANGLLPLLAAWGIQIDSPPAELDSRIATGIQKTVSAQYGNHPVAKMLRNTLSVFSNPCSVSPIRQEGSVEQGDKPSVTPIVFAEAHGNATYPIAVASELGAGNLLENPVNPRLFVCGDSDFVSNANLSASMEGNRILFLSALEWLTGFQVSATASGSEAVLQTTLPSPEKSSRLALRLCVFAPLGILVFGLFFWIPLLNRLS